MLTLNQSVYVLVQKVDSLSDSHVSSLDYFPYSLNFQFLVPLAIERVAIRLPL